jgi:hypothetical protein
MIPIRLAGGMEVWEMLKARSIALLAVAAVGVIAVPAASAQNFFVNGALLGVATPVLEGPSFAPTIGGSLSNGAANVPVRLKCGLSGFTTDIEEGVNLRVEIQTK